MTETALPELEILLSSEPQGDLSLPVLEPELKIVLPQEEQLDPPPQGSAVPLELELEPLQLAAQQGLPLLEAGPAQPLAEPEAASFQESSRNLISSRKKGAKQSLRTYQDLVSIIQNKSACEWQESRYSVPSKPFSPEPRHSFH